MRFMVMCFPVERSPLRPPRYELATPRVFASLEAAERFRFKLMARSPGREPITVVVVRPEPSEHVWYNQHGAEFLFLFEYEDEHMGTCVWLLDEDGIEVGIPKAGFLKSFSQAVPCSDCGGCCSVCKGTGRVRGEES